MKISKYVLPSLVIGASLVVGASDVLSTHMELLTPIREKGGQVREMITMGFGILASIALIIQVARGCTASDPNKKTAMFMSAGWIAVGCVCIYNFPKVLSLVGVELG